eukprot:jgi/Psemu1/7754/gm1.7754_g
MAIYLHPRITTRHIDAHHLIVLSTIIKLTGYNYSTDSCLTSFCLPHDIHQLLRASLAIARHFQHKQTPRGRHTIKRYSGKSNGRLIVTSSLTIDRGTTYYKQYLHSCGHDDTSPKAVPRKRDIHLFTDILDPTTIFKVQVVRKILNFLCTTKDFPTTTNIRHRISLLRHATCTPYFIENGFLSVLRTYWYHPDPLSPNIDRDIQFYVSTDNCVSTTLAIYMRTPFVEAEASFRITQAHSPSSPQDPHTTEESNYHVTFAHRIFMILDIGVAMKALFLCFNKDTFDAYSIPIILARQDSTQTQAMTAQLPLASLSPTRKYNRACTRPTSDYDAVHTVTTATVPPLAPVLVWPLKVATPVTPPTPRVTPPMPVPITCSTPTVHHSPPTPACKTAAHYTVDNPETPTGLPGSSNSDPNADSTTIGTPSYTWNIVHPDITTGNVPPEPSYEPHSTRACTSSQVPPSCISSLQLPPSGALSMDSFVPSSVHAYSQHGASSCPVWKPLYGANPVQKPLYGAHSVNYQTLGVCITKWHRDALKIQLCHLHANLLFANWLYDGEPGYTERDQQNPDVWSKPGCMVQNLR